MVLLIKFTLIILVRSNTKIRSDKGIGRKIFYAHWHWIVVQTEIQALDRVLAACSALLLPGESKGNAGVRCRHEQQKGCCKRQK